MSRYECICGSWFRDDKHIPQRQLIKILDEYEEALLASNEIILQYEMDCIEDAYPRTAGKLRKQIEQNEKLLNRER